MQKDPSLCSTALTVIGYIINMGSILSLITLNLIFLLHRYYILTSKRLKFLESHYLKAQNFHGYYMQEQLWTRLLCFIIQFC